MHTTEKGARGAVRKQVNKSKAARDASAKWPPKPKVARRETRGTVFVVDGVVLPPGLRPRGAGFQADFREWGHGQPTLKHSKTGQTVTDPTVAKEEYPAQCRALAEHAAKAANGHAQDDAAASCSLAPADYVPRYVALRYAQAEAGLAKKLKRKFGAMPPTERDRKRALGYVRSIDHYLERIFGETSFATLTSIQQITRKRIKDLVAELYEMRVAHPKPMPKKVAARIAKLPVEEATVERERWEREHHFLKPPTIRVMMMALSGLLTHAIDNEEYEGGNPCSRHKAIPPQYKYGPGEWLEVREAQRLLDYLATVAPHWRNPYGYEMTATLLYTGMRKDEMMIMAPDQLDFVNKLVHIRGTKTDASVARVVPMWPAYEAIMRAFYEREGLLVGDRVVRKRPLLFPGRPRGGKQGAAPVQKRDSMLPLLKRAAQAVGIKKKIVHHTMRHTYASVRVQMVEEVGGKLVNVTKDTVRRELGHESEGVLDAVYVHELEKRLPMTQLDYAWQGVSPTE
jgi:integrase